MGSVAKNLMFNNLQRIDRRGQGKPQGLPRAPHYRPEFTPDRAPVWAA